MHLLWQNEGKRFKTNTYGRYDNNKAKAKTFHEAGESLKLFTF